MVHPGQFVDLALMAEFELSIVLHLVVDYLIWFEVIVEDKLVICIFEIALTDFLRLVFEVSWLIPL